MKKAEILLVQPRSNRFDFASLRAPSGLLTIAAQLDQEGYKITILDTRKLNEKEWKAKLVEHLKSGPVCVGLSASTGRMIQFALEISQIVRDTDKNIPIIWGGMHPTLVPLSTIQHPLIDVIIHAEADLTFPEVVHAIEKGKPLKDVKGIWFKQPDGKIVQTPERPVVQNLDDLPPKPYHLINLKEYSSIDFRGLPSIDIETSRGCPYRCNFCYLTAFDKKRWRAYSPKRVLEHMQLLKDDHGIRDFYFLDDNFATDVFRFREILQGMIDNKMDVMWGTQGIRMDALGRMEHDTLALMDKSGCGEVSIGVESGSQRILDLMQKDTSIPLYVSTSKKLAEFKFVKKYNAMMGFPSETKEEMQTTINQALMMSKQDPNAWFPFNIYTPYPGTPMYKIAVEYGFNEPTDLEGWMYLEPVGWQDHYKHWFTPEISTFMSNVNFASYFAFKSTKQKITNKWGRMLFDVYHPIAKTRFKNGWFQLPIERKVATSLLEI